jgi:hypothetical protein
MTMTARRPGRPRIGPGAGSVAVELYAAAPSSGRWDRTTWDGGTWATLAWQRIDCEVVEAHYRYGVTEDAGILSVPDSGPCDLETFDPDRTLDPSNPDSPYFTFVGPGTPIRLRKVGATSATAWTGFIDEASYDVASGRGRIRCVDGIAYLAQADLPAGLALPNTLRARVRAVVAAVGLTAIVPVQPEAATAQLVVNSDFENGITGWTAGSPQSGGGVGSSFYTQAMPAPENPPGVPPFSSPNVGTLFAQTPTLYPGVTSARFAVLAGGTYLLGGWSALFPNPTVRQRGARVYWFTGAGAVISGSVDILWPTSGGAAWVYKSANVVAPAGAEIAEVWFYFTDGNLPAADCYAYVDQLTLTGPDPATSLATDPPVAAYSGNRRPGRPSWTPRTTRSPTSGSDQAGRSASPAGAPSPTPTSASAAGRSRKVRGSRPSRRSATPRKPRASAIKSAPGRPPRSTPRPSATPPRSPSTARGYTPPTASCRPSRRGPTVSSPTAPAPV